MISLVTILRSRVRAWTIAACVAGALSCRSPNPVTPPLGGSDAGSPGHSPTDDDTTTGHPIGPISKVSIGLSGFGSGGGGTGGSTDETGGASGTGGTGGVLVGHRAVE